MRIDLLCVLIICGLCTACGGDDETSSSTDPNGVVAMKGTVLGTRDVPGYTVTVAREGEAVAGKACVVRMRAISKATQPRVATVQVWAASSYQEDAAATIALPAEDGSGDWIAHVQLPADLSLVVAWVRLTLSDGAIIEVGEDFPLL